LTARVGRDFVFPVKFDRKRPAIRDRAVPFVIAPRQNFAGVRIFKPKNEESFLLLGFSHGRKGFFAPFSLLAANALQGLCCGSGVNLARSPRGPHITSGREAIRVAVRVDACVAFGVC